MTKKFRPNRGSTLDSLLEAEGVKEAFEAQAIKEVIAWQLMQAMEERNLSKRRLAQLMHTRCAQLDRLLDPERDVTLGTLQRAAAVAWSTRPCRVDLTAGAFFAHDAEYFCAAS